MRPVHLGKVEPYLPAKEFKAKQRGKQHGNKLFPLFDLWHIP